MTRSEQLEALVAKVEALPGPDRDVDAEVWWLTADHSETDPDVTREVERLGVSAYLTKIWPQWRDNSSRLADPVPSLTGSIDAVVALKKRVLPDVRGYELIVFDQGEVEGPAQGEVGESTCDGLTGPTALLAALLAELQNRVLDDEEDAGAETEVDRGGDAA